MTMMMSIVVVIVTSVLFHISFSVEAFSTFPSSSRTTTTTTSLFYRNARDAAAAAAAAAATVNTTATTTTQPSSSLLTEEGATALTEAEAPVKKKKKILVKKPTIYSLTTLDDLQYFLEDDEERLTVIKYHASWCKSCQKLGQHYHKLAMKLGDGIIDRHKVKGQIRFADIRYFDETKYLVTKQLNVRQVPTLQLYIGKYKIWEEHGMTNTTSLNTAIENLQTITLSQLYEYAESIDDGILQSAIDDAFFDDSPSFLDEEW